MTTMELAGEAARAPARDDEAAERPDLDRWRMGALPAWRLRRVTEYIEQHLDQELSLARLGAVVYMSPYHFARLFQHSTGVPPHRFVVRARVDRAAALLAQRDVSIARVARAVGFRTASHFSTVFRRAMGITPRGYRDRLTPPPPGGIDAPR